MGLAVVATAIDSGIKAMIADRITHTAFRIETSLDDILSQHLAIFYHTLPFLSKI